MGQGMGGGNTDTSTERVVKLPNHIVLTDVVINEVRRTIDVPEVKLIPKEYEVPVIKVIE